VKSHFAGILDPTGGEYLDFIYGAAKRMSDLISAILEYSRVATAEKERDWFDCEDILQAALANLAGSIESSGARITRGTLPRVFVQPTQLTQLFQNLIGNAIKFRRDGAVPQIRVDCQATSGAWLFSVKDNGIGIDDQYREKVFRIFQRLHGPSEYPGTGIGLAICKKVVEAHGGSIWLERCDGEGSTFCFMLPREANVDGAPAIEDSATA
jgi:light-regulated signal transduction histidine kinase (bacteriophytochrome)